MSILDFQVLTIPFVRLFVHFDYCVVSMVGPLLVTLLNFPLQISQSITDVHSVTLHRKHMFARECGATAESSQALKFLLQHLRIQTLASPIEKS